MGAYPSNGTYDECTKSEDAQRSTEKPLAKRLQGDDVFAMGDHTIEEAPPPERTCRRLRGPPNVSKWPQEPNATARECVAKPGAFWNWADSPLDKYRGVYFATYSPVAGEVKRFAKAKADSCVSGLIQGPPQLARSAM
jgi:hypothetical protein